MAHIGPYVLHHADDLITAILTAPVEAFAHGILPVEEVIYKLLVDNRHRGAGRVVAFIELAAYHQARAGSREIVRTHVVQEGHVVFAIARWKSVHHYQRVAVPAGVDSVARETCRFHARERGQAIQHAAIEGGDLRSFISDVFGVHVHHDQAAAVQAGIEAGEALQAEREQERPSDQYYG